MIMGAYFFKLRPWLGHLPIPLSKTGRAAINKRKADLNKQIVKVGHTKKCTVTVLLGLESDFAFQMTAIKGYFFHVFFTHGTLKSI